MDFYSEYTKIQNESKDSKISCMFYTLKSKLNGSSLVLYGAGKFGRQLLSMCKQYNIAVNCFCDRRTDYADIDVPIITPKELQSKYSDAHILVCSVAFNSEICNDLKNLGFDEEQITPCPSQNTFVYSTEEFNCHIDGYRWAYDFFEDEISKKTVLDRLRMYLHGTDMVQSNNAIEYFDSDIIKLLPEEVFIDGGCYNGLTAVQFIDYHNVCCRFNETTVY